MMFKKLRALGRPKKSDEEMLVDAKDFIASATDKIMMAIYGTAIMGIDELDELDRYFYNCIIDGRQKYDVTKGEFIEIVKMKYEEL